MLEKESRREIKDGTERETIRQIAEDLGRLPLALELAGGFMRYRQTATWENYLSLLKQNPREAFKGKFLEENFTNHDTDVYRTLKVSETLFNDEPLLRDVLDLLTWSGTSPMGIDLMSHLLGKNEIELLEPLSLGESLRLLQKSPDRNAYAIHRLVAEVRKEDIPLEERATWADNICQLLGDWFQNIKDDFTKLSEYEAELEHLTQWQEHAGKFSKENASRLLWLQGYPPYYRGNYKTAIDIVGKAIEVYKQTDSTTRKTLAHLYNDFGNVLGDLGKYQEQFNYTQKALEIRLDLFGEKHHETAISYNNLGYVYGKLGKPQDAINNHKKALEIRLELFGEKHPNTANSYNNLGVNFGKLGKPQDEFNSYKKALEIYLELFGKKHPETARSYNNHGIYYAEVKDYKNAAEYILKALNIRLQLLGTSHPDTINSVLVLTSCYTKDGKGSEALKLIDKYLNLVSKTSPEYKQLMNQRAWILERIKRDGFRQQPKNPFKNKGKNKRR